MNESEPAATKWFRRIFPKRKKPEEMLPDAQGLTKSTRSELMEIMNDRRQSAPTIVHMLRTFQDRVRVPLDTGVLRTYADKFRASAEVVEAITMLERGMFENSVLRDQLNREERTRKQGAEISDLSHDVAVLELEQRKKVLKGPLPQQLDEARMLAELEKLTGSRKETTLKMWQQLVEFHRDHLRGMDIFKEETDKDIEAVYQETISAIPSDAPDRDALMRAAAEAREELRRRRDWLIADMARYLAEKLGADRRKEDEGERRK